MKLVSRDQTGISVSCPFDLRGSVGRDATTRGAPSQSSQLWLAMGEFNVEMFVSLCK
jgi:hypothetical protein